MRVFDATVLNTIANDPEVRPWMGGEGELDLTGVAADPGNVVMLVGEQGGFIMVRLMPGCYEVHTIFKPVPGGYRRVRMLAQKIVEYMFIETECVEILTKVPKSNAGADQLCNQMRFQETFVRKDGWRNSEPMSYRKLDLDRWAAACSTLAAEGAAFHGQLEAAKVAQGSALETHPHDPVHDRMVGLAVKMAKAGNVMKGVNFYNRWALFTGYQPIECVSIVPAIVDVHDAVIQVRQGAVEVLQCR